MKDAPLCTTEIKQKTRKLYLEQLERQHLIRRFEHLQLEAAVLRLELPICSARIAETSSDFSLPNYTRPVDSQQYRAMVAGAC
jgi:hypothetical protein